MTRSCGRYEQKAHPSFAQVISQINSDEANFLADVLYNATCPIVEIRIAQDEAKSEYQVYQTNIPAWMARNGTFTALLDRVISYVNNWEGLGLVYIDWTSTLSAHGIYKWADEHPSVIQARAEFEEENVILQYGVMRITDYGKQFHSVVIAPSTAKALEVSPSEAEVGDKDT